MFGKLKRYRLKKNPHSLYAKRQMDKAAKKAGFSYAVSRGVPYYVEEMKPENTKNALKVRHYLHCHCNQAGIYNETCCVALFSGGVIETNIHLIGECPFCHYLYHPTPLAAIRIRERRSEAGIRRNRRPLWW